MMRTARMTIVFSPEEWERLQVTWQKEEADISISQWARRKLLAGTGPAAAKEAGPLAWLKRMGIVEEIGDGGDGFG